MLGMRRSLTMTSKDSSSRARSARAHSPEAAVTTYPAAPSSRRQATRDGRLRRRRGAHESAPGLAPAKRGRHLDAIHRDLPEQAPAQTASTEGRVEHLADLGVERERREGLLQEGRSRDDDPMPDDGFVGVARRCRGREGPGADPQEAIEQGQSIGLRHDGIGSRADRSTPPKSSAALSASLGFPASTIRYPARSRMRRASRRTRPRRRRRR